MAPGLVARVVIVCAVLVTARSATAEQRREVAVIDLSATPPAKKLADDVYNALVDHADLQPLRRTAFIAALHGDFLDEDGPRISAARAAKQAAEDYLSQQLDDVNAARAAADGMRELSFVVPTSETLGLYAELAFVYGQAQLGLRKPNDASLAFQLAHRLDSARTPDPTRYPPNIIQAYQAAVKKPTVAAKLEVKGEGRVWIDGIEQGVASGTFDTSEGLHLVQLSGPDRATRGQQVRLPQVTVVEIPTVAANDDLRVKRARVGLARARDPAERASAMKRLAKLLGVQDAVLISKGDGNTLMVQTWRDEKGFSAHVQRSDEPVIELLTPLAPARVKPRPAVQEGPTILEPPIVVEKRWYQKNWVRASIAGGLLVGIVSTVLYARRSEMLTWDTDIKAKEQAP